MKNNLLWAKTLLSVYRYLERIAGAIDKLILKSGLGCTNVSGQNYFYNNVFAISQKIIDLSQRKVTLINLKILIEDTLSEIDQSDAQILIERFFDGVKARELCEKHGISMRTAFRKIDGGLNSFSKKLAMKNYGEDRLSHMLKNENWINNVYQRLLNQNEEDVSLSNSFLEKAVNL